MRRTPTVIAPGATVARPRPEAVGLVLDLITDLDLFPDAHDHHDG